MIDSSNRPRVSPNEAIVIIAEHLVEKVGAARARAFADSIVLQANAELIESLSRELKRITEDRQA